MLLCGTNKSKWVVYAYQFSCGAPLELIKHKLHNYQSVVIQDAKNADPFNWSNINEFHDGVVQAWVGQKLLKVIF